MKAIAAVWVLALVSCSGGDATTSPAKTSTARSAASTKPAASASASSTGAATATAATATAATTSAVLTAQEFCAQAVQLGEEHLANAAPSDRANVESTDRVKDLASAPKECAMRVESANVELHGDVAQRCIEAARKRGGRTTFFTFFLVPECSGVLTGKAGAGQPVLFAEECAPGLAMLKNRCSEPVGKNARCDDFPAGLLGKIDEHPRCQDGLECFMTFSTSDGYPSRFACLPPSELGAPCKLDINTCPAGSSCYQGKCRARVGADGDCMRSGDCAGDAFCEIKGGVFGKCVPKVAESASRR